MSRWRVIDGPNALGSPGGLDGEAYGFVIENSRDPAQRKHVRVDVARTVLVSDADGLITDVRRAVETDGVSALERFLDDPEPPDRILVSSIAITRVE